jgi:hypothetical protein
MKEFVDWTSERVTIAKSEFAVWRASLLVKGDAKYKRKVSGDSEHPTKVFPSALIISCSLAFTMAEC